MVMRWSTSARAPSRESDPTAEYPAKGRGAVDQDCRAPRDGHGAEASRWQDGGNDQAVDMPVGEVVHNPAFLSLLASELATTST
jgi:hypothetical protein